MVGDREQRAGRHSSYIVVHISEPSQYGGREEREECGTQVLVREEGRVEEGKIKESKEEEWKRKMNKRK